MENELNIILFRASDGNTVRVECRDTLPSTAALAKEYARNGYPDRYVVFAEKQTAESAIGGPVSENEPESGLYLSCILRPSIFPSQAGALGALSALALASALEEHTMQKMSVGWVSDVYSGGYKIGHTSVEGKLDNYTSYEYLIVSFSVKLGGRKFSPRLTDMVRRIFEDGGLSIPMIMAKTVLNRFFAIYREIKSPAKHLNHYVTRFALTDNKVKLIEDGKKRSAKVVGVSKENLALILEMRDGTRVEVTSPSSVIIPKKLK